MTVTATVCSRDVAAFSSAPTASNLAAAVAGRFHDRLHFALLDLRDFLRVVGALEEQVLVEVPDAGAVVALAA